MGWNLCMNRDKLWVKVIQAKYKCGVDILPTIEDRRPRTNLWCGIVKNWENLMPNLIRRVGNGNKIRFWEDIWVHRCDKLNQYWNNQTNSWENIPICFFVNAACAWDVGRLSEILCANFVHKIKVLKPPCSSNADDYLG